MTSARLIKAFCCVLFCSVMAVSSGCIGTVKKADLEQDMQLFDSGNITVYQFDGGTVGATAYDQDWYNKFLDYYQKEYGGTVSSVAVEWQGWEARFNKDLASGVAPDLIYLYENNFYPLLNRGLIVSVEEMDEKGVEGTNHPSLFIKQKLASDLYSANGKTYSFACAYAEADMIFVNEDLFSQYGVTSPYEYYLAGRWDMAAFKSCAKLITRDTNEDGKNDLYGYYGYTPYAFVASTGGELVKLDENGKFCSYIENPQTLQGLANYRSTYANGYATEYYSKWMAGKTAMMGWTPQGEYGNLVNNRLDFNWSVVPFPLDNCNQTGVRSGRCYGWAVSASSINWQGCVNYVVALNKYSVINPDFTSRDYDKVFTTEQLEMFSDCTDNIQLPLYNGVGELGTTQWDFWGALSDGKISEQKAINLTKAEIDRQIKK